MITTVEAKSLWDKIKPIKTGMLTTDDQGVLRSRPMQKTQDDFDGTLYFFTHLHSGKVEEAEQDREVNVSFVDPSDECYVSLSGTSRITQDKQLIDKFWNAFVSAWFPNGKDDPEVALFAIQIHSAEYWDNTDSKMVQLFKIAKANATKTPPHMGDNRKFG